MVLKIIGVLLAAVIILLLAVVLALLFIPVRYRFHAEYDGQWAVSGTISWFFHIVHIPLRQGKNGLECRVRLFGIRIGGKKKPKKHRKPRSRRRKKTPSVNFEKNDSDTVEDTGSGTEPDRNTPEKTVPEQKEPSYATSEKTAQQNHDDKGGWFSQKILLFRQRLGRIYHRLLDYLRMIPKIWESIRQGGEKLGRIRSFWKSETTGRCWDKAKDMLRYLWRHSHPRRIRGDILFGTGDPCSTGEILGALAIVFTVLGKGVHVTPDFDSKILRGELALQGRIRLVHIIRLVLRVLTDKDWRQFRKELNQLMEGL